MPPSKHSGSSMSAHKDSDQIATDSNYALGDYSFRIERTSVPGSINDKIEAICTDKDGKNARKSIQLPSTTKLDGYYVEANESEATVYALVQIPIGDEHTSPLIPQGVASGDGNVTWTVSEGRYDFIRGGTAGCTNGSDASGFSIYAVTASAEPFIYEYGEHWGGQDRNINSHNAASFTYNGKTVYYGGVTTTFSKDPSMNPTLNASSSNIAWTMIYGTPSGDEYETKQVMIGRFAIDIEDAGGVGPGSDWVDPGDYDPEWEEGDPTHTLYVEVTGALSGRHNDPIVDPSYSYIPADKDTVKDYGCGGDGGHGGGGGAGASTVVIHKFATNQANSKEVTAIARRHGYGSGGGKGGKGGDGCILVYY